MKTILMKKRRFRRLSCGSTLLFATIAAVSTFGVRGEQAGLAAEQDSTAKQAAVAFLTDGVRSLPVSGLPGPVVVWGENAFPVVVAQYERGVDEPLVVASSLEKGRILAFGHDGYLDAGKIRETGDMERFFLNALLWTAQKEAFVKEPDFENAKSEFSKIKIAVWQNARTADYLKSLGFDATVVRQIPEQFDVFVAVAPNLSDEQYATLTERIEKGAGFITGGLGWGWLQLNPGKSLNVDHRGNRNLIDAGFAWADGSLQPASDGAFDVRRPVPDGVDGAEILKTLNKATNAKENDSIDPAKMKQIATTAVLVYRSLPPERRDLFKRLENEANDPIVPTAKKPVRSQDLWERLTITTETERFLKGQLTGETPSESIPALAAGSDFPGSVPKDAPRLENVALTVEPNVPGWQSSGLYAAPGETIRLKIDEKTLKATENRLRLRIGSHSDTLWHLENWDRYPEITIEKTIDSTDFALVNPFGGAIYLVVPPNFKTEEAIELEISGAVAAPYFVKDKTSLDDWKTIRNNPAPWAELQGKNIIVTVPSSVVRNLDDPQELMETWDKILDLIAEFCSVPKDRVRPERICPDRQISAGYMHSGYPVMTWLDVQKEFVDNELLNKKGNWGFFHELGHNHQSGFWTFDGTGEVTVNYFSLYVYEKLCGLTPENSRGELSQKERLRMLAKYIQNGRRFEDWKSDPFLALNMTVQLQKEFGWEPFIKTIAEYRTASNNELPKNDLEKRDQWMTRLSRNVGRNLGPFFEFWGVPTSREARNSLIDLPVWTPKEFELLPKN